MSQDSEVTSIWKSPFTLLTLEEALDFIEDDELLEVTPESLRMRKRYLTLGERKRNRVA